MSTTNRQPAVPDVFGLAVRDYLNGNTNANIDVYSDDFNDDIIPVKKLFRKANEFSDIEKIAMILCEGKILDAGAGAGCHSLYLNQQNQDVLPIDFSPLSVECMKERGLENALCLDIFKIEDRKFDTILLLMNGTGIAGTLSGLKELLDKCHDLLLTGGQILIDSTDLCYLHKDADGSFLIDLNSKYYGEISFSVEYKGVKSPIFSWLYTDFDTLDASASASGFNCKKIIEGPHYDFLAQLTKR